MFFLPVSVPRQLSAYLLVSIDARPVDAHTAQHLYRECLKGELMHGRTLILVSHHVQLCAPGAGYIVALDNGRVDFQGGYDAFQSSDNMSKLIHSKATDPADEQEETKVHPVEEVLDQKQTEVSTSDESPQATPATEVKKEKKSPRKLVEEEKRAVGHVDLSVWKYYITSWGGWPYWILFTIVLIVSSSGNVIENAWLK